MSYATFEDVNTRFYREIDPKDRSLIEARLQDAEVKIRRRIPDLDLRVQEDATLLSTVVAVCCDAVIRLIHNPEGFLQESDGNYSYMREQGLASSTRLEITPDEWADLGVRSKIAVIHPIINVRRPERESFG